MLYLKAGKSGQTTPQREGHVPPVTSAQLEQTIHALTAKIEHGTPDEKERARDALRRLLSEHVLALVVAEEEEQCRGIRFRRRVKWCLIALWTGVGAPCLAMFGQVIAKWLIQ